MELVSVVGLGLQGLESLGILNIASDVVNALGDFAPERRVERGWSILGNLFRQHLAKTLGRVVVGCESHDGELLRKRSEEHTSELQSLAYLVCRLLLEKK